MSQGYEPRSPGGTNHFPTKPKRDYWAQYRNAQRTVFSAQGKFSNFLDRTRQRKSWCDVEDMWNRRNITRNHQQFKKIYRNLFTINPKREECSRFFSHLFCTSWNKCILTLDKTQNNNIALSIAGAFLYLHCYNEWIFSFVTSVLKVLQLGIHLWDVMWHSSKAFYTETTYSPRREWLTMQK